MHIYIITYNRYAILSSEILISFSVSTKKTYRLFVWNNIKSIAPTILYGIFYPHEAIQI